MNEWDIEAIDRIQLRYPTQLPGPPVGADIERGKQTPNIVPIIQHRFGFIGKMFDIVRTQY